MFNLDFALAKSVRFVPVNLGPDYSAVLQTDSRKAFLFLPSTDPVILPSPRQDPDAGALRDCLNSGYFADDFKHETKFTRQIHDMQAACAMARLSWVGKACKLSLIHISEP